MCWTPVKEIHFFLYWIMQNLAECRLTQKGTNWAVPGIPHSCWEPHTLVRASRQCQQIRQNNMHGNKSARVWLQKANVEARMEREVRNLHVKGSTSQTSRWAEGGEQTRKVRKCCRECSRKVTALQRGVEAQDALLWAPFLTKEI